VNGLVRPLWRKVRRGSIAFAPLRQIQRWKGPRCQTTDFEGEADDRRDASSARGRPKGENERANTVVCVSMRPLAQGATARNTLFPLPESRLVHFRLIS